MMTYNTTPNLAAARMLTLAIKYNKVSDSENTCGTDNMENVLSMTKLLMLVQTSCLKSLPIYIS